MVIAGNERYALTRRESDQVIVVGIGRSNRWWVFRRGGALCKLAQQTNEGIGVCRRHPRADLRLAQGLVDLLEQCPAHDEFEVAFQPLCKQARRHAGA